MKTAMILKRLKTFSVKALKSNLEVLALLKSMLYVSNSDNY
jgi:hypothetical protein